MNEPAKSLNWPGRLGQKGLMIRGILGLAFGRFFRIDGAQWAGAFAFNAFFSLFPLMILLVTIASSLIDRERAGKEVIAYIESYVPLRGEMQRLIFDTIANVISARKQAGAVAILILIWSALQCFFTLICVTNRAWGIALHDWSWWRLPLKSLVLLGITTGAVFVGIAAPVLMKMGQGWLFKAHGFPPWILTLVTFFIPIAVMLLGLCLFYRFAPRRPTRFAEVWAPALCATLLLRAGESLFVIYLTHFATLNAVYGAFGGIMALLLWIFVSGCIFIFGACLCASQAEMRSLALKAAETPKAQ